MRLRNFLLVGLMAAFATTGCDKAEDAVKENLMTKLITENIWVVTRFDTAASSIVDDFAGYEFQFNKDGSVWGIKAGQPNEVGTWLGSEAGESITSEFPSAGHPLNLFNGVWAVYNTDLTPKLVDARRFEGGTELVLRLNAK